MGIMHILMGIVIIGGIAGGLILFTTVMTDFSLKKNMINKGYVNEDTQAIFKKRSGEIENKYPALKWGLILFFGGASLVAMEYLGVDRDSPLPYGLFILAVSLGFLVYYFIVKKELKK
jgi:hypothetical protein